MSEKGLGHLLDGQIDPQKLQGYLISSIENMLDSIEQLKYSAINKEDLEEIKQEVKGIVQNCNNNCNAAKEVLEIVFGNKDKGKLGLYNAVFGNGKPGLLERLTKLETAFKIKGGLWGIVGGGGFTAVLALIYVLLKGHV